LKLPLSLADLIMKAHATSHATDATMVEGADTIGDKAAGK